MNVDRICQYIESKLPRSTWEFHGPDIRRFIEAEAKSQSGVIRDLAEACQDLVSMTDDDRPGPGTSHAKLRSARARAAKLLEVTQYPCEAMSTELLEASQSPCKETCERSLKDYRDGQFTDIAAAIIEEEMMESAVLSVDFKQLSKVKPESMREVIGIDTTGVISDVREFGRTLTPAEVAAVCRGEEVPCEASS